MTFNANIFPYLEENNFRDILSERMGMNLPYFPTYADCYKQAVLLALYLTKNKQNHNFEFTFEEPEVTAFCFKVILPSGQKISISVPPDANKSLARGGSPTFETALFEDDKLVYSEQLGLDYSDVCRFMSHQEVLDELIRVNDITLRIAKHERTEEDKPFAS